MSHRKLESLSEILHHGQKRYEEGFSNLRFYKNVCSSIGSEGFVGILYRRKLGDRVELPIGGCILKNGKIIKNDPPVSLVSALEQVRASPGDILVLENWRSFDKDPLWYCETYYYVLREEDITVNQKSGYSQLTPKFRGV